MAIGIRLAREGVAPYLLWQPTDPLRGTTMGTPRRSDRLSREARTDGPLPDAKGFAQVTGHLHKSGEIVTFVVFEISEGNCKEDDLSKKISDYRTRIVPRIRERQNFEPLVLVVGKKLPLSIQDAAQREGAMVVDLGLPANKRFDSIKSLLIDLESTMTTPFPRNENADRRSVDVDISCFYTPVTDSDDEDLSQFLQYLHKH